MTDISTPKKNKFEPGEIYVFRCELDTPAKAQKAKTLLSGSPVVVIENKDPDYNEEVIVEDAEGNRWEIRGNDIDCRIEKQDYAERKALYEENRKKIDYYNFAEDKCVWVAAICGIAFVVYFISLGCTASFTHFTDIFSAPWWVSLIGVVSILGFISDFVIGGIVEKRYEKAIDYIEEFQDVAILSKNPNWENELSKIFEISEFLNIADEAIKIDENVTFG